MTEHLSLMSKPRLMREVGVARADAAHQRALAEFWRDHAEQLARTAESDRRALTSVIQTRLRHPNRKDPA